MAGEVVLEARKWVGEAVGQAKKAVQEGKQDWKTWKNDQCPKGVEPKTSDKVYGVFYSFDGLIRVALDTKEYALRVWGSLGEVFENIAVMSEEAGKSGIAHAIRGVSKHTANAKFAMSGLGFLLNVFEVAEKTANFAYAMGRGTWQVIAMCVYELFKSVLKLISATEKAAKFLLAILPLETVAKIKTALAEGDVLARFKFAGELSTAGTGLCSVVEGGVAIATDNELFEHGFNDKTLEGLLKVIEGFCFIGLGVGGAIVILPAIWAAAPVVNIPPIAFLILGLMALAAAMIREGVAKNYSKGVALSMNRDTVYRVRCDRAAKATG